MIYIIGPTEHQLFENTDLLTTGDIGSEAQRRNAV